MIITAIDAVALVASGRLRGRARRLEPIVVGASVQLLDARGVHTPVRVDGDAELGGAGRDPQPGLAASLECGDLRDVLGLGLDDARRGLHGGGLEMEFWVRVFTLLADAGFGGVDVDARKLSGLVGSNA